MQKVQFINFEQHTVENMPVKKQKEITLCARNTERSFIFRKFIYKRGLFWIVEIFEMWNRAKKKYSSVFCCQDASKVTRLFL